MNIYQKYKRYCLFYLNYYEHHNVYMVNFISVSWNTWIMIFLTLGHCSPSKPQPILGIDMLVTPWLTQWCFIAIRDDCKLLYVGLWKYFSLVTLNDEANGMSLQQLGLIKWKHAWEAILEDKNKIGLTRVACRVQTKMMECSKSNY